jgi:hypothetical protein
MRTAGGETQSVPNIGANLQATLYIVRASPCLCQSFDLLTTPTPPSLPPTCKPHANLSLRQKAGSTGCGGVGESHAPLRQPVPTLLGAVRSRKQK